MVADRNNTTRDHSKGWKDAAFSYQCLEFLSVNQLVALGRY